MAVIQTSVILQLLLALWRGLCAAVQDSAVCKFFRRLGRLLRDWPQDSAICRLGRMLWVWTQDSAVYGLLLRIGRTLRGWAQGSSLCRLVCREGALSRAWPESMACRALNTLANLPAALLRRLRAALAGNSLCRYAGESCIGSFLGHLSTAPVLCLGVVVLALLVTPHESWNNLYGLAGAAAVLFFFYAGAAARPRRKLETARMGPYLALYTLMICLSLVFSRNISLSVRFFLFHVTALLLAVLTVSTVQRFEQLRLLAAMAVLGITVAALYGCWQIYAGTAAKNADVVLTLNGGTIERIFSFFDNPNNFAELLVMLVPLDFALFSTARTGRGRFFAAAALVPCLISLAFTYSRSGFVALLLAVVLFFAFQNRRVIPVCLLLVLLIVPLLPESIYDRILSITDKDDTSLNYRLQIYEKVGEYLKDHWARGAGLGSDVLQEAMKAEYTPISDGTYPIHAHDNYLQMWCETGILGLLSLLALLGGQIKAALRAYRRGTDPRVKVMLAAAVSSFCGILAIGIPEYTWFYPRNMFVYFFLFGLIGACVKLAGKSNSL